MADSSNSIFNRRAADRLASPDDLDKYVRVTRPGAWAVVAAMLLLLAGVLAWGVFGAVSTSVRAAGACVGSRVVCFIPAEDVARVRPGDFAMVDDEPTKVVEVSSVPLSREEAHTQLGNDYLVSSLFKEDWGYMVTFDDALSSSVAHGVPLTVDISTERMAPLALLLG